MLSEPRSSLLPATHDVNHRIESGSLNLSIILTAWVGILFPGGLHQLCIAGFDCALVVENRAKSLPSRTLDAYSAHLTGAQAATTSSISVSRARVAALVGRVADVVTYNRHCRS
jgi:hypothetical protein